MPQHDQDRIARHRRMPRQNVGRSTFIKREWLGNENLSHLRGSLGKSHQPSQKKRRNLHHVKRQQIDVQRVLWVWEPEMNFEKLVVRGLLEYPNGKSIYWGRLLMMKLGVSHCWLKVNGWYCEKELGSVQSAYKALKCSQKGPLRTVYQSGSISWEFRQICR